MATETIGQDMEKDSLERLLEDIDRVAVMTEAEGVDAAEAYFGGYKEMKNNSYVADVLGDVSRRLHALMPHDASGKEIKCGEELTPLHRTRYFSDMYQVRGYEVLPVGKSKEEEIPIPLPCMWVAIPSGDI